MSGRTRQNNDGETIDCLAEGGETRPQNAIESAPTRATKDSEDHSETAQTSDGQCCAPAVAAPPPLSLVCPLSAKDARAGRNSPCRF